MTKSSSLLFLYFICFAFLGIVSLYYSQTFILTDDFYLLITDLQMSDGQFEEYLKFVHKWQWLSYFFVPLALILRIGFVWICLKAGSFITDRFTDIFLLKISIQAEIVFAVGLVTGIFYSEFFVDVKTLELLSVNPFSLQVLVFDIAPKWSHYFFNTLNIFEICYVLWLAYLLAKEANESYMVSLRFVASAYLPGLALWILLVTYLSVLFQL